MDRFDRIFALHNILNGRRTPVSREELEQMLESSRATVQRAIRDLREVLGAPLEYDRELNGYKFDSRQGALFELPGLWFNPSELYGLLAAHRLLTVDQPGLLDGELQPLRQRIEKLLSHRRAGHGRLLERVRVLQMAPRPVDLDAFRKVVSATEASPARKSGCELIRDVAQRQFNVGCTWSHSLAPVPPDTSRC